MFPLPPRSTLFPYTTLFRSVLRSAVAVRAAAARDELTLRRTSRVINAPLLGFGQTRHAGFAKGRQIHYYELGTVKVAPGNEIRSEEHTSELQSRLHLVCRLL